LKAVEGGKRAREPDTGLGLVGKDVTSHPRKIKGKRKARKAPSTSTPKDWRELGRILTVGRWGVEIGLIVNLPEWESETQILRLGVFQKVCQPITIELSRSVSRVKREEKKKAG